MIEIKRTRYIVIDNEGQIFCGLARNYKFKPINNIGDTSVKTYLSENKARSSFLNSWYGATEKDFKTGKYRVVAVTESIAEI